MNQGHMTLRIPTNIQDSLSTIAKANGVSRSDLVRKFITAGLSLEINKNDEFYVIQKVA